MTRTFTSRLTSFQPTRPRGARPQAHARDVDVAVVSTHTPARGATSRASQGRSRSSSFNPRAREGRDPSYLPYRSNASVSTHAPARGATSYAVATVPRSICFNPRAREGRDRVPTAMWPRPARFNPRAHEGRDVLGVANQVVGFKFQPTRPRGARPRLPVGDRVWAQFQPTRPRGARPSRRLTYATSLAVSTHAPARGATGAGACTR